MKRQYNDGVKSKVVYFIGSEVEKTPAYGMKTLFVVGLQPYAEVTAMLTEDIHHIFFGANHSFNPNGADEWQRWEELIREFLDNGYLCSLDIPITKVEEFHEGGLCELNNFIPQIRVAIPYIRLWNYNTMLKIDDTGFNDTNPGVWCHSLHDLQERSKFTSWTQYNNDEIKK